MVKLTQSLSHFMITNYPEKYSLLMFGHVEEMTEAIWNEYIEWCKTDEGRSYLKGGSNYREDGEAECI